MYETRQVCFRDYNAVVHFIVFSRTNPSQFTHIVTVKTSGPYRHTFSEKSSSSPFSPPPPFFKLIYFFLLNYHICL